MRSGIQDRELNKKGCFPYLTIKKHKNDEIV
jgi:hypothetical protein